MKLILRSNSSWPARNDRRRGGLSKWKPNLTLELGLRYDWFIAPTERFNRFVNFDPAANALVRVGSGIDDLYGDNKKNIQPRIGFAWDPFKDGKTSVRGGYSILADQPVTNLVTGNASNPPLATPLTFNGAIRFDNAAAVAAAAGVAPAAINDSFDNAYVQSWNLNVQREIKPSLGVMIGYFGSKGTHLRISRNLNQLVNGVRPFAKLSAGSPILPSAAVGNITVSDSAGNSSYNALWISANKCLSGGLQFNASYTLSKSLDYNSLNSQGVVVQDSRNIRGDRGLSDYDARHRFVINAIYELPFHGSRFVEGWQLSTITPGRVAQVGSTTFGVISTTRFPTGDSGSSRQIQFALKLIF